MRDDIFQRFKKDIKYDIAVSPYGYDFFNMTKAQAAANFEWFISIIPHRMEYFRERCASDLKIRIDKLNYSSESLILVWRWFLAIARLENTPADSLKKMKKAAEVFGDSFINKEQFTVCSQFILKDIGMYIGQSYILNYPQLSWSYHTKPKNEVNAKQPVISGFYFKDKLTEGALCINPLSIAEGSAANVFWKKQRETDVFDYYMKSLQWIPRK